MARIVGPASLNVDITGYAPRLPKAGETVPGRTLEFSPGGKGNNQMTAAHRAGAEVFAIGCRGEDMQGQILHRHYATEGMSEAYIRVDPFLDTATALIEIDERDGQNRIMVILAANRQVDRTAVLQAEAAIAEADVVLTQLETTTEAVMAAKELAQKHKKFFILNPAPYVPLPKEIWDGISLITPNETEAEAFTGVHVESVEDCRQAAACFRAMGVRSVAITLGCRGVYYTDGEMELTVPAISVRAINTTGAGDAFNGALATAIGEGQSMAHALRFATATAALSVTRPGAAASMPMRPEIEKLMQTAFGDTP